MAAGLGFKTFTTGEVLTAADTNGYLMQGVLVFASSAARSAAITSPQEGQMSFLKDTNVTEYYDGAAWVALSSSGQIIETVFTSSNATYTIPQGVTGVWALCIGSGGGGGASSTATASNSGGGGGAGQAIEKFITLSGDTTLNITVPAGGAGGTAGGKGSSGSAATIVGNQSATTYLSAAGGGGGGGGAAANVTAISGASGGGTGSSSSSSSAGGGGGMGMASSNAFLGILNDTVSSAGNGALPTTVGVTGYSGGASAASHGGAGINIFGRSVCGGGLGGGSQANSVCINFGAGAATTAPAAGNSATANTGAGGNSGKTNASTALAGGNGASGLVVLRYVG